MSIEPDSIPQRVTPSSSDDVRVDDWGEWLNFWLLSSEALHALVEESLVDYDVCSSWVESGMGQLDADRGNIILAI